MPNPFKYLALGLIWVYRNAISPLLGPRCRHVPTCSDYAQEAITRFGVWRGGWLAVSRILRCHPWGTQGLDPVPEEVPHASALTPWKYGRWTGAHIRDRFPED
ncbi:membrane protein insertion efficiency factor YidD [Pyruvatibacter mobilis]|uniref:membrane protein insertion efficiency factor YidD n=1 Tax=Pyruvatibacter mobilis TaxID=1712261 RepID=UPI003BA857C0